MISLIADRAGMSLISTITALEPGCCLATHCTTTGRVSVTTTWSRGGDSVTLRDSVTHSKLHGAAVWGLSLHCSHSSTNKVTDKKKSD